MEERIEDIIERLEKAAQVLTGIKKDLNRLKVFTKKGYVTAINIANLSSKVGRENLFILGDEMRRIQGEEEVIHDNLSEKVRLLSGILSSSSRLLKEVLEKFEKGD